MRRLKILLAHIHCDVYLFFIGFWKGEQIMLTYGSPLNEQVENPSKHLILIASCVFDLHGKTYKMKKVFYYDKSFVVKEVDHE